MKQIGGQHSRDTVPLTPDGIPLLGSYLIFLPLHSGNPGGE